MCCHPTNEFLPLSATQLAGRKRILLVDPAESALLYADHAPMALGNTPVDPAAVDLEAHPPHVQAYDGVTLPFDASSFDLASELIAGPSPFPWRGRHARRADAPRGSERNSSPPGPEAVEPSARARHESRRC